MSLPSPPARLVAIPTHADEQRGATSRRRSLLRHCNVIPSGHRHAGIEDRSPRSFFHEPPRALGAFADLPGTREFVINTIRARPRPSSQRRPASATWRYCWCCHHAVAGWAWSYRREGELTGFPARQLRARNAGIEDPVPSTILWAPWWRHAHRPQSDVRLASLHRHGSAHPEAASGDGTHLRGGRAFQPRSWTGRAPSAWERNPCACWWISRCFLMRGATSWDNIAGDHALLARAPACSSSF